MFQDTPDLDTSFNTSDTGESELDKEVIFGLKGIPGHKKPTVSPSELSSKIADTVKSIVEMTNKIMGEKTTKSIAESSACYH